MKTVISLAAGGLALAGCAASTATTPAGDTYFVREGMVNQIDPAANAIWNLQVEAMDDEGNFDPALMDGARWTALAKAARDLQADADRMAAADFYIAANPAGTLGPAPEGTDLAAIQARLTTNEAGYRSFSRALAEHATKLVEAAEAKNVADATRLTNDMQPVCKSCHDVFWYPEQ